MIIDPRMPSEWYLFLMFDRSRWKINRHWLPDSWTVSYWLHRLTWKMIVLRYRLSVVARDDNDLSTALLVGVIIRSIDVVSAVVTSLVGLTLIHATLGSFDTSIVLSSYWTRHNFSLNGWSILTEGGNSRSMAISINDSISNNMLTFLIYHGLRVVQFFNRRHVIINFQSFLHTVHLQLL